MKYLRAGTYIFNIFCVIIPPISPSSTRVKLDEEYYAPDFEDQSNDQLQQKTVFYL